VVPRARVQLVTWGGPLWVAGLALAAAGFGAAAALWSLSEAAALLGVLAVCVAALAEPLVALGVVLVVAPFAAYENIVLAGVLPRDSGQLFFGLLLVAWAGQIARRRALHVPRSLVLIALLVFEGFAALSLLQARSFEFGVPELIKWVEIALMLVFVVDQARDRRRLAWVVALLLLAGVVQALIGVYQFAFWKDAPPAFQILGRFYRAYGTFQQPNPFAGFVAMMLALGVGTLAGLGRGPAELAAQAAWQRLRRTHPEKPQIANREPKNREPKTHYRLLQLLAVATLCVVVALLAGALLMSWSRGGWIGFAAAGVAMLLVLPRRVWLGPLIVAVALLVVGGLWSAGRLPSSVVARLTDFTSQLTFTDARGVNITDENYSLIERLSHWQAGLAMWQENFWWGVGFSNFQPVYDDYRLFNWEQPLGHAHNFYINVAAETGVFGLLAYLALWAVIFWQTWRTLRRLDDPWRGVAVGLLGAWVHLSVHHVFDNLYVDNVHIHVGVLLGVLCVLAMEAGGSPQRRGDTEVARRLSSG
jgi:putative inorganic carbon (HCO3(-)) transporter